MTDNHPSLSDSEAKFNLEDRGPAIGLSKNRQHIGGAASPAVLSHLSESNHSMEEVFGTHFDDALKTPTPQDSSNLKPPTSDEWFNGGSDMLSKADRDDGQLLFTSPVSLYMPSEVSLSSNGVNGRSSNRSLDSMNAASESVSESVTTGGNGSLSSRGSTPSNSVQRPLLYSAIGSLENPNPGSLGSLSKRLSAAAGKSRLIPPASITNNRSEASFRSSLISPEFDSRTNYASPFGSSNKISKTTRKDQTLRKDNTTRSESENVRQQERAQKENTTKRIGGDSKNRNNSKSSDEKAASKKAQKPSNLRQSSKSEKKDNGKRVSYDRKSLKSKKQVEMFRPSSDAYTPRIGKKSIKYKEAENRTPVQTMATTMGTLQRPNFRDALRRVAMIMHQHITKIERRFEQTDARNGDRGLFTTRMRDAFSEENFCTPTYKCTMVRIPMARPGMVFGLRQIKTKPPIPSEKEIYEFAHQLFNSVQLSSECSIVCLIYVERLMEIAKVPLLACTWRPIFMCGLLLASKVWQDLSSWNIEFASVYPQFSLDAINKLEVNFLRHIKWDLYISSRCVFTLWCAMSFNIVSNLQSFFCDSLYAKYYFALRSLVEKVDFRQRYNRMVGRVDSVAQSEALKIQERSEAVKEEALLQLSRSM